MSDRTIARILKVNHAGEFGAIRIYRAQLWYARTVGSDLVPFLTETLSHEIQHLRFAQSHVRLSALNGVLKAAICISTEVVIWLSTQGAVPRMVRAIRSNGK